MTDEVQTTTEATATSETQGAETAPQPAQMVGTPTAPVAPTTVPLTPEQSAAKATALHLAIAHSSNQGAGHGAEGIVEMAETFWRWLVKEVEKVA